MVFLGAPDAFGIIASPFADCQNSSCSLKVGRSTPSTRRLSNRFVSLSSESSAKCQTHWNSVSYSSPDRSFPPSSFQNTDVLI